jgi:hypothetical protein
MANGDQNAFEFYLDSIKTAKELIISTQLEQFKNLHVAGLPQVQGVRS